MGIDGIGKGGAPPPATGIDGPAASTASEIGAPSKEFNVRKVGTGEAVGSASLDQVRSGAISVEQYLDLKVDEATAHLAPRLGEEQLSFIRTSLREQLSSDPALIDLVKATTGQLPPPSE
jgi:hypothetical protein